VIIGGGAAGLAAADILRREGYTGPLTIVSADSAPPTDRPNLSKDYLAGEAQEDWIPLRSPEFYSDNHITLALDSRVTSIDVPAKEIVLENGQRMAFGALLIATGAEPVRLPIPGGEAANVHYLRSFADSQAIIAEAKDGARAVVAGASFIGLEVAASLRTRGVHVDVVAPEPQPLAKVLGPELGRLIRGLHEAHGVRFHLETTVAKIDGRTVHLGNGETIDADFVVIGAGVHPVVDLAKGSGLAVDHGVIVDEYLETAERGIFAAGDTARWLDPASGERLRVEHWVVALRQGQCAARNILGRRQPFDAVPFFWSQHYDTTIRYIGHAEKWDRVAVDGDLDAKDCAVSFTMGGRLLAKATISRDRENLETEVQMEQRGKKA
jgi:NADPH-dependent 2,4-dienoyl-CoA reductase/sulfur reductase-like enzyme